MLEKKSKILVVEDNKDEAKLIEMILSQEGYEVTVAPNGKKGLELVDSFEPDLIVLDVMMPELDGFSATKKLKASEKKDIPIILLTGVAKQIRSTRYPLDGVLKTEAEEYLEKPVNPEELLKLVKKYVS
jgi:CheY-like chemotaxis protein